MSAPQTIIYGRNLPDVAGRMVMGRGVIACEDPMFPGICMETLQYDWSSVILPVGMGQESRFVVKEAIDEAVRVASWRAGGSMSPQSTGDVF
jgi:hypothetical protein